MCFRPADANIAPKKCPKCGTVNAASESVCKSCGEKLEDAPSGSGAAAQAPGMPPMPGNAPGMPPMPGSAPGQAPDPGFPPVSSAPPMPNSPDAPGK